MYVKLNDKKYELKLTIRAMKELGLFSDSVESNVENMGQLIMGLELRDIRTLVTVLQILTGFNHDELMVAVERTKDIEQVFTIVMDFFNSNALTKAMYKRFKPVMDNALKTMYQPTTK